MLVYTEEDADQDVDQNEDALPWSSYFEMTSLWSFRMGAGPNRLRWQGSSCSKLSEHEFLGGNLRENVHEVSPRSQLMICKAIVFLLSKYTHSVWSTELVASSWLSFFCQILTRESLKKYPKVGREKSYKLYCWFKFLQASLVYNCEIMRYNCYL